MINHSAQFSEANKNIINLQLLEEEVMEFYIILASDLIIHFQ